MLNRENPFWQDMTETAFAGAVYYRRSQRGDIVREAQRQLAFADKNTIAFFFSPNYLQGWQRALAIAAGEVAWSLLQFSGLFVVWLLCTLPAAKADLV
ncbi:TDP-N-acetylfucosamine:lipid II N-acetylfucosaminyltransferase [Escherichia coli]|uniref:TDP-N-acetylfucosamine:lipid II N-acetylfucosaminyltransferase n=1 Tax=Escherichia coli TaxID=562 RepID=UPI00388D4276